MNELAAEVLRLSLGIGTPFSWLAWAYVSVILLVVGPVFAQVAPKVVDPPAVLLGSDPVVVGRWVGLSIFATFAALAFFVITIIGAPAGLVIVPSWLVLATMAGYIALARLVGELLLVRWSVAAPPPWAATAIGIVAFRLVRAVPFVGAAAHSLLCVTGYAAVCAVTWRLARSWHRRRMPDAEQFRGETLVEWYPDGDPEDGAPSVGSGRPVLGNIRGDEDRASGDPTDPRARG
jgi:hypothetical protein